MFSKIVILDGYTDEPAGLGVPPYINTYPRLIAGAVWLVDKNIDVRYWTIDDARRLMDEFLHEAKTSDLVVFIAGSEVPGRYIGGRPISFNELYNIASLLHDRNKILVGPAARYGFGHGGGRRAYSRREFRGLFTDIVYGDVEIYLYDLLRYGWEKAEPWRLREDYRLTDKAFRYGAKIIIQHPNYGWNLIVEIETYRGCTRWISGGCSFCIEPRYGRPLMRSITSIVEEIGELYRWGARHFRLGKQPDILAYMARGVGEDEYPKPDPEALEKLFYGIRTAAPGLRTLHIDNVNPGTIIHHIEESIRALKFIVKYHTPGDVAALGVESFDPEVIKRNNLKTMPDETIRVVEIINRIGGIRGWNGLPHLLPGINLLYGLPGESRETYRINYDYLKKILDRGYMVRRINIRKVAVLENTPLWMHRNTVKHLLRKHNRLYEYYRVKIMDRIDRRMMERILPPGTLHRYLYVEKHVDTYSIARFPGSYPVVVKIPVKIPLRKIVDARIRSVSAKSVIGLPS